MVGWSDLPADLSDTAALARLSQALPEDAVMVASDLRRARATADAIAGPRQRLPDDPDLREMHFGAWELQPPEAIEDQARLHAFWDDPGAITPPGGESWDALSERVDRAVMRLLQEHPGRDIVAVAHFGVILTRLQAGLRVAPAEVFAHRIDNLSVTELSFGPTGWQVGRINHRF